MNEAAQPNSADASGKRRLQAIFTAVGPLLALVVVLIAFGIADKYQRGERAAFLSVNNIRNISEQTVVAAVAVLMAAMLKYTIFGRYIFAVGSNEATARLCGINIRLVKIGVYTLAGLFVGAAGILQFTRLTSGDPTGGVGLELKIIAAVVIGGGSLSGGRGSILGTIAGAAIMVVIASGCNILGISNSIQDIVIGAIIIAAVTLDQFRQRRLAS